MNTQNFEQLIYQFFGTTCLDIEFNDKNGVRQSLENGLLFHLM